MGTDAADPQDLLRTIGVARPMGELALDLYRPNSANLPAVVEALAREAGLDVQPTRSHFDLLELVRVARLDPIDAFRACSRQSLQPSAIPRLKRTFRWLDRLDAIDTVYVRRPGFTGREYPPSDRSRVLLGLMNGGTRAIQAPDSDLDRPKPGDVGKPVTTWYPAHVADLAFFAGAAEAVCAAEAEAWALREALVAWGLAPFTGVAWSFRPLRWAVRHMNFSVLAPIADAKARARIAHGWEPRRVASVARHFEWASDATRKLAEYLDGFLCDLAEWERLVTEGAVVPPNEALAAEDRAFPPLTDALVGRAFRDLPSPYAPLVRMLLGGVMPRWVNVAEGRIEISMPTWAREDS